jgi:hypothetical protein
MVLGQILRFSKDEYQDYDIVFACHDIQRYVDDQSWIDPLGKPKFCSIDR